jgi:AAA+ ATPase superfamily predicted ATPase
MILSSYGWPARERFLNRTDDLARLEEWWEGDDRNALALYGRRRVGKSWLLRAFADGKPALVLVADQGALARQLSRFADVLERSLGLRPELPDLPALFRVLYRLAAEERVLVVIDELPYLLPGVERARREVLSEVQATMEEERDASQLKLVLCGSHIAQMRGLLAEESPLRGRLTPLQTASLSFAAARPFLVEDAPERRIERFAVAGGMAMYLVELSRRDSLRAAVCGSVLDSRGPLFNDPREILEEEFRRPGVYFSLLEELAVRERGMDDLTGALRTSHSALGPYLKELVRMQLVEKLTPRTAQRDLRYRLSDDFLRFWFRFVFPYQESLRSGLDPRDHYDAEIAPVLAEHVAPVFEGLCRRWVRRNLGTRATTVGPWWGRSLDRLRAAGERGSEEIDVVGASRSRVTVVGECKWTSGRMTAKVLDDLERFKLPALRQAGARFAAGGPEILLFSKRGFKQSLVDLAADRADVRLVGLDELDRGLRHKADTEDFGFARHSRDLLS